MGNDSAKAITVWILGTALSVVLSAGWVVLYCFEARRSAKCGCALILTLAALGLTVLVTQWPLRCAFAVYQGELGRYADRVQRGYLATCAERIGPFVIQRTRTTAAGTVYLWMNVDPTGCTGFLRVPPQVVMNDAQFWRRDRLGAGWYFVVEE